jgi:hypothetical protein
VTLVGQLSDKVFAVGRVHDIPVRLFGVPIAEPVVVPRDERDVLHARFFGHGHPFFRIKQLRVENVLQLVVIVHGYRLLVHHPFAVAQDTVRAEVDKQAKPGFFKPAVGGILRLHACSGAKAAQQKKQRYAFHVIILGYDYFKNKCTR